MTKVRAPMLLNGSNMAEVRRLEPSGVSLSRNLTPPSTADMTLPFDAAARVPMRSWIRLYDLHGDAGVYRVSASDTDYDTEEQRLTLEHGITSLRDTVVPSPADAGTDSEVKKPAPEMLTWILGQQGTVMWRAGTCAATENVILDKDDSSLLDQLLEMMDQLPEYDLSFDQSSFPWTVSVVRKSAGITAEGRLSRNLGSVRVTYDDSELCTRVYYNIKSGDSYTTTHMDAPDAYTSLYGIVEGSLYLNSDTKKEEATRIATRYLEKRREPAISVELDAVDLSIATGESIDAFTLGKKFRLTIPAYGLIVDQWITGIHYADVYGDPEHVTLTLGNRIADIAQRAAKSAKKAAKAQKSSSGSGGGGARSNAAAIKQDQIQLAIHDEYITALDDGISVWREDHAEMTIGQAMIKLFASQRDLYGDLSPSQIKETLRQAGVTIDANKSLVELFASMATTYDGRMDTAESRITVNAGQIALKASQTDVDALGSRVTTAEINIDANRGQIELKVSKDGIISSINQTAETIKISASKIDLQGYVTASNLAASIAALTSVSATNLTVTGSFYVGSDRAKWQTVAVVTNVSLNTARAPATGSIALTSNGTSVSGGTSFNYGKSVTVKKRDLYFLGQDTGGEY